MKLSLRKSAAVVSSLGLLVGFGGVAGASAGTNSTTGPNSWNTVKSHVSNDTDLNNNNHLAAYTSNPQGASTGSAKVWGNTNGGSASSGAASNSSSTSVSASVNNSASSTAALNSGMGSGAASSTGSNDTTGPDSHNAVVSTVKNNVDVNNNNSICVTTSNTQTASSGNAEVSGNTNGGSASTGNASNNSNTTVSLDVTN